MLNLVGRRINRYKIVAEIGRGGMARVYRAIDSVLGRQVALKVLAPQLASDPEFSARFRREGKIVAALQHPHIVTLFDVGETDGIQYLAMDFIDGRSMYAVIRERDALPGETVAVIIRAVASALDYAHSRGAIHRDVKPQNILVDTNGRILLTDFGISLSSDEEAGRLTRTGLFMGTPEYMSPEQVSGTNVDYRTDLYSLAVTAYELFSGDIPFRGNTPDLIVAHAQKIAPPLQADKLGLPEGLIAVMAKSLAKNPDDRYQSGAEFSDAIDAAFAQLPSTTLANTLVAGLATPSGASPKVTQFIESDEGAATNPTTPTTGTGGSTQPRRRNMLEARSNVPYRPPTRMQGIPLNFILPIGIGLIVTFLLLINTTFAPGNSTTATPQASVVATASMSTTPDATPSLTSTQTPVLVIIIPTDTVVVATNRPRATRTAPPVPATNTAVPATAIPATATAIPTNTASATLTATITLTNTPSNTVTPSITLTPSNTRTLTVSPTLVPSATSSATSVPPTNTALPATDTPQPTATP
ncbi:MAG: protein kinase domain-containing protein [Roseiflexaceae bacterium]